MVKAVAGGLGPFTVEIESKIPIGKGLGSSAALLAATTAAMRGSVDTDAVFPIAAEVEGHPDNVAAAVFGGLVAVGADGNVNRLSVHPSLHVVLAVPDEVSPTTAARSVLELTVAREVAVRTAARIAMLVEGLRTGDADVLGSALGDEIHEAPRAAITATPGRLIDAAMTAGASYAAWSGAGPSVVGFATEEHVDTVIGALDDVLDGGEVMELEIDRVGVRFE
jgi:homoserine kinase